MLMNLLPGLRELRAPLVSGYLWLISAWLFLGQMEWLPTKRPPGNGQVARVWDLGGTLGKTVVLAVVTFLAYLIGSFLEMNPDGRFANWLTPIVFPRRRPWYLIAGRNQMLRPDAHAALEESDIYYRASMGMKVAQSISSEARRDLKDLFERRKMIPAFRPGEPVRTRNGKSILGAPDFISLIGDMACDEIAASIIQELQQLASRLLVKNKELYGKYDRHMSEASVRMNASIPLTVLLVLATWPSEFPLWLRLVLTLVALAFGFMLLRQGFVRAVSARDVIVQALVIGEVESRYIPSETAERAAESTSKRKEPTEADQKSVISQDPSPI